MSISFAWKRLDGSEQVRTRSGSETVFVLTLLVIHFVFLSLMITEDLCGTGFLTAVRNKEGMEVRQIYEKTKTFSLKTLMGRLKPGWCGQQCWDRG